MAILQKQKKVHTFASVFFTYMPHTIFLSAFANKMVYDSWTIHLQGVKDDYGGIHYCSSGKYHRVDGPAYVYPSQNVTAWFNSDMPHRVDGPAITTTDYVVYYWYGHLHRVDGPAFTQMQNGNIVGYQWWVNGKKYDNAEEYMAAVANDGSPISKEKMAYLILTYGGMKDYANSHNIS